jgi:hypothetical protein
MLRLLFGWLLCPPIQKKPSKSEAQSPSLFLSFSSLHSPSKAMSNRPPLRVPPVIIASTTSIPPPTSSFGWLLCRTIEQRPSKTGAPPVSQIFDGRHFDAPNKGKTRSAREPGRPAPLLGLWGATAPRFKSMEDVSMEREGKAGGGRVIIGSSCVVCCCVCVCLPMYPHMYPICVRPKHYFG